MFELGLTDQSRGQDGWILVKVLFICIFMDRIKVNASKNTKKNKAIIQPSCSNQHRQFTMCIPPMIHLVAPQNFA